MTSGQPSARSVLRWLLPVVVGVLVLVATIALAVKQSTPIPDQRLDQPHLGLYIGILVAILCFVGLILLLIAGPSAVVTGPPRKKKKNNWLARAVMVGLLLLLVLWARKHQADGGFRNPLTGLMGGGNATPVAAPSPTPAAAPISGGPIVAILVLMGLLVVAAAVVGVILARRLRRDDLSEPLDEAEFAEDGLEAALGAARAATFSEDDPRSVVISCYETFEGVLERRGVTRQANQTASTVLDRAMIRGLVDAEGVAASRDLIDVFERARFSPHEMVRADVERARAALDGIQASVSRCRAVMLDMNDDTNEAPSAARR